MRRAAAIRVPVAWRVGAAGMGLLGEELCSEATLRERSKLQGCLLWRHAGLAAGDVATLAAGHVGASWLRSANSWGCDHTRLTDERQGGGQGFHAKKSRCPHVLPCLFGLASWWTRPERGGVGMGLWIFTEGVN